MECVVVCVLIHWLAVIASGQGCDHGDLRLIQTPSLFTLNSGRLEICLQNLWGTIRPSASFWPVRNVQVACQQLGFAAGLNSVPSDQLGSEDLSGLRFQYLQEISCDGTEETLAECLGNDTDLELSVSVARTSEVFVICLPRTESYSRLHTLPSSSGGNLEGDIRLVGNPSNDRGAVEIYSGVGWVSVCPEIWSDSSASVICEQLGYESGMTQRYTLDINTIAPRRAFDVDCTTTLTGVQEAFRISAGPCHFIDDPSTRTCSGPSDEFAGVACSNTRNGTLQDPAPVRLLPLDIQDNEDDRVRGIVEVLYDGRWGPLCRPPSPDALEVASQAACVEMGYKRGGSTHLNLPIDLRSVESRLKPTWIRSISCPEDSSSLEECLFGLPVGFATCDLLLAVDCDNSSGLSGGAIFGITVASLIFFIIAIYIVSHVGKFRNRIAGRAPDVPTRPTITETDRLRFGLTAREPAGREPAEEEEPSEPERTTDTELTKAPPPSYQAATKLPQPKDEDLPPSYSAATSNGATRYPPPATGSPPAVGATPYPPPATGSPPAVGATPYPPPATWSPPAVGAAPYPPPTLEGDTPYSTPLASPAEGTTPYPPPTAYPPSEGTPYPPSSTNPAYPPPAADLAYPPPSTSTVYPLPYPDDTPDGVTL